jgi:hypothetical protein
VEEGSVEALDGSSAALQVLFDLCVAVDRRRVIEPVPKDALRPGLLDQLLKDGIRRAASQHQRRTEAGQAVRERGERVVEPPAGCATERPDTVAYLVEDKDGDNGIVGRGGGGKRRIVRKA